MEKMLVTNALNEIKTLDARINRAISSASFVEAAKTSEKNVSPRKTKEAFAKDALSAYDSISALIARREAIKSAIIESNAKTMISICGGTYSVAKVIDMKSSIEYQESLLESMTEDYNSAVREMNERNESVERKIDSLVTTAFGKESKTTIKPDDYDAIAKPYRESNEYSLVDPLGIERKIAELREFIEEFKSTVDSKLQISNCVTYIEF